MNPAKDEPEINLQGLSLFDVIRLLCTSGGTLLDQGSLHLQLVALELAAEQERLLGMLWVLLLGFACLLCVMLFGGGLVLVAAWDTPLRAPAALSLFLAYGGGMALAWRSFRRRQALGEAAFAASREELGADAAALKVQR